MQSVSWCIVQMVHEGSHDFQFVLIFLVTPIWEQYFFSSTLPFFFFVAQFSFSVPFCSKRKTGTFFPNAKKNEQTWIHSDSLPGLVQNGPPDGQYCGSLFSKVKADLIWIQDKDRFDFGVDYRNLNICFCFWAAENSQKRKIYNCWFYLLIDNLSIKIDDFKLKKKSVFVYFICSSIICQWIDCCAFSRPVLVNKSTICSMRHKAIPN